MQKIVIAALAATTVAAPALADQIVSKTPIYDSVTVYEDVQICKETDGDAVGGAIIGGIIGSVIGNGISGADGAGTAGGVIGAIIGANEAKPGVKCHTEKRVSHTENHFSHYRVVVEIDGKYYTINTN